MLISSPHLPYSICCHTVLNPSHNWGGSEGQLCDHDPNPRRGSGRGQQMDRKEWAALRSLLAMFPRTIYGQTLSGPSSLRGRESPLWKTPAGEGGGAGGRAPGRGRQWAGTQETDFSPLMPGVYRGSGKGPDCIRQGLRAGPLPLRRRRGLISRIQ